MALFEADKPGVLWESVALPNAFICEYMPSAPEGFVKVYLYGLLYARYPSADDGLSPAAMARELGMEEADIDRAYRYWERCRLIARTQDHPPRYVYLSVQQAMMGRQTAPADEGYMQFAQALYSLFGDRRKLHGGETQLAYEWVEQLGLPREVVVMMVQHLINTRGPQFSFKEAQKLAVELSEQHIVTVDAAEQVFSRSESAWKATGKILRRMGKYRSATMDKIDLYLKWTTEWGYAPKAIETACAEMTAGDPSFKYLDSILKGLRSRAERKSTTSAQLEKQLSSEKEENQRMKELFLAAGIGTNVNAEGARTVYHDLCEVAPYDTLLLAARELSVSKKTQSLDRLVELVKAWRDKGLTEPADVQAYLDDFKRQNAELRTLFDRMGRENAPTASDRELLRKWRQDWHVSDELIALGAEYSQSAARPMAFLNKVLQSWREQGVSTVEAARADHDKRTEAYAPKPEEKRKGKTVIEQQYAQREYDPSEYDGPTAEELEEASKL